MFDIGFFELLVVGIIALAVLGPEQMMTAARTVGRYIGRARQQFHHIGQQIEQHETFSSMQEMRSMVEQGVTQVEQEKETVENELRALQGNFTEHMSVGQKIPDSLRGADFAHLEQQVNASTVDGAHDEVQHSASGAGQSSRAQERAQAE